MNYRGSYRKLLGNAKAAIMAAIELYNKPTFQYRDECVVILLLNAWELILKATLSKSGKSIYYHKKRNQPYRTLSWKDALSRCSKLFPKEVDYLPVRRNLEVLGTYRDNAVHFYNEKDFSVVIHALAQTCIKNFRDFLEAIFHHRLENEITWQLMPLGIQPPIDLVSYISGGGSVKSRSKVAVRQFLAQLAEAADEVKEAGADRGRLMTVFSVKLESVKKIGDADLVVGVEKGDTSQGPLAIVKTQDPNVTHPLLQKDILEKIGTLYGNRFTQYTFQAIARKYGLRDNHQYCWRARDGRLTKYSNDVVAFIRRLSADDVKAAITDYKQYLRSRRAEKKKRAS